MDVIAVPLIQMINVVVDLFIWVLLINIILSWLVAFNVVNTRNRFVYMVGDFTSRVTEPALRPIRRFMPNLGGIDVSPLVLILGLYFAQGILTRILMKMSGY